MGSDRARISFDPTRQYRSVIAQQGRVTLEADVNEQASIAAEALRLETLDIIGPAGTPDDGYKVSVISNEVVIGKGTMYVGGWRLHLAERVPLDHQPDWLDRPVGLTNLPALVALLVAEQEISATEDQPLLEVALGGPDTAARTRLMQHFLEIGGIQKCAEAPKQLEEKLVQLGLAYDPKTAEVRFRNATLQVSFQAPTGPPDPCCPPAQGGYLGADNQLVQVTVSQFDAGTHSGKLLWGWNNASFLYRAKLVPGSTPPVLALATTPVDAAHTPQPGQAIEVLQTEAILEDPADQNYVAAPQGTVVTLGSGTIFDPTTNQLTLPAGTPINDDPRSLFVRLWQGVVPFTTGTAVPLDAASGLMVTVQLDALPSGQWLSRPFWRFAVRPNTPQQIYPERYLDAGGTHPDGPRQWLCDLAILSGSVEKPVVSEDCRVHFKPITELQSCDCCELSLAPSQDWQLKLNQTLSDPSIKALSVCFQPGQFDVASTITIPGSSMQSIKMTGAGPSTRLIGAKLEVVLEFDSCASVGLFDLSVSAGTAGFSSSTGTKNLQGAVTLRQCNQVDIERVSLSCADGQIRSASCLAVYNPPPPVNQKSPPTLPLPQYNVRVLNSQFRPGHSQVGILMVNADRAQIEGNLIDTAPQLQKININDLAKLPALAGSLQKHLVNALTITDTAPPATKKAIAKLRKKQAAAPKAKTVDAAAKVGPPSQPAPSTQPPSAPSPTAPPAAPAQSPESASAKVSAPAGTAPLVKQKAALPHVSLGAVGLAHVTATFGTVKLHFISNDKLGSAWNDAIRNSGLTDRSSVGIIHKTIKSLASTIVKKPDSVAPAFRNYLAVVLPLLYSTSSQGIVVGGDIANDVRILNNTVSGTAQGIHVGLSNEKTKAGQHLAASVVQICGNTINVRVTPATTGDRHGIFLGSVNSAMINDNEVELTRTSSNDTKFMVTAGQPTYAIEVIGLLGSRLLIERNRMLNFTGGVLAVRYSGSQELHVWKIAENASTSQNNFNHSLFISADNNMP